MRTWLSGRASPCQGEGRGFESRRPLGGPQPRGGVAERRGNGLQSRLHGFESRLHLVRRHCRCQRAISSVGERFLDTEEVTSSILVSPTQKLQVRGQYPELGCWPQIFFPQSFRGSERQALKSSGSGELWAARTDDALRLALTPSAPSCVRRWRPMKATQVLVAARKHRALPRSSPGRRPIAAGSYRGRPAARAL